MIRFSVVLLVLILSATSFAAPANFNAFVDATVDQHLKDNPTHGTQLGFHRYDAQLEDYSQKAIAQQTKWCHATLAQLAKFDRSKLTADQQIDASMIESWLHAQLLELEEIRMWQRNPDSYSSGIAGSAFVIMSRNYASQDARLQSLIARERQMPAVFAAARANLKNPPRVYTEVAIQQLPGIESFFEHDVPAAFKNVTDQKLLTAFHESNARVLAELKGYGEFLQRDTLPKSNGDFRIGASNYARKLQYEEMVDIPLDRLLEIGKQDLVRNQQEFIRVAKLIDPAKTPEQILEDAEKDHPTGDLLLQTFRDSLEGERRFIIEHKLLTIPSPVLPIIEETPPFMRALTSASMDTPGPWEKVAKEAYFNVTLPEKDWSPERTKSWLEGFNRGTISSTSIHEAYPGHYVQFLVLQVAPVTKTRKILSCGSNAEGWAHYSEQMMLDEGFGRTPGVDEAHDTAFLKLRLGQLQDALLRDARFVVGVEMHTGKMTFDEGIKFFENEGRQTHEVAYRETKRGTSDPTYLVYTVGKLEIMKLREDYKRKMGANFTIQDFHDRFLQQGAPPVKIVRKALLGDDSPTL
ncbi:MAG TPA: DUF885 domain-containing protein [Candidatus Saccharimonadales bacterium]|nr:DUF885 domain-containing protein [Candidatus Saccharimonadales bacterium]